MASFCVEKFGTERIMDLQEDELQQRIQAFRDLVKFNLASV